MSKYRNVPIEIEHLGEKMLKECPPQVCIVFQLTSEAHAELRIVGDLSDDTFKLFRKNIDVVMLFLEEERAKNICSDPISTESEHL
jgi:hypothetical protein